MMRAAQRVLRGRRVRRGSWPERHRPGRYEELDAAAPGVSLALPGGSSAFPRRMPVLGRRGTGPRCQKGSAAVRALRRSPRQEPRGRSPLSEAIAPRRRAPRILIPAEVVELGEVEVPPREHADDLRPRRRLHEAGAHGGDRRRGGALGNELAALHRPEDAREDLSSTATTSSTKRRTSSKVCWPTCFTRSPSMTVSQRSSVTSSPASTLRFIAGPSEDSTPTTRMPAARASAPPTRPRSAHRRRSGRPPLGLRPVLMDLQPHRPLPEIRSRSSNGWTYVSPSGDELSRLLVGFVPDRPVEDDLCAVASRGLDLRGRRVLGHADDGANAEHRPASARPARGSRPRAHDARSLLMRQAEPIFTRGPRILYEPVRWNSSAFEPHLEAGPPRSGFAWSEAASDGHAGRPAAGRPGSPAGRRRSRRAAYSGGTVARRDGGTTSSRWTASPGESADARHKEEIDVLPSAGA